MINFDKFENHFGKAGQPLLATYTAHLFRWTPPLVGRLCTDDKCSANVILIVIIIGNGVEEASWQLGTLNAKEEKPGRTPAMP